MSGRRPTFTSKSYHVPRGGQLWPLSTYLRLREARCPRQAVGRRHIHRTYRPGCTARDAGRPRGGRHRERSGLPVAAEGHAHRDPRRHPSGHVQQHAAARHGGRRPGRGPRRDRQRHRPGRAPGRVWTYVSDRGPNGQIKVDGKKRRTFPVPGFDPAIVKIRVFGDAVEGAGRRPRSPRPPGSPSPGCPTRRGAPRRRTPMMRSTLTYNPNGVDTRHRPFRGRNAPVARRRVRSLVDPCLRAREGPHALRAQGT